MKLFLVLILAAALTSCGTIAPPAPRGSVDHVVLIAERPGNPADRQAILSAADELRVIPGMQFLDHGTALASPRPVVDDSFDVAFNMRFDSPAALSAYETNPLHVKKVTEVLKPLSRKILVYDIVR